MLSLASFQHFSRIGKVIHTNFFIDNEYRIVSLDVPFKNNDICV